MAVLAEAKYVTLQTRYDFQSIAVETLGPINESATSFLCDIVRRTLHVSGEDIQPQFLFQRISVANQRFNAVLLHDGFFVTRPPGLVSAPDFLHYFLSSRIYLSSPKYNNNYYNIPLVFRVRTSSVQSREFHP